MSIKSVFVLDKNKKVLEPCHSAVARKLLKNGDAAVWNRWPFTIILKKPVEDVSVSSYTLSIDPGSKHTGLAIIDKDDNIIFKGVLNHRGNAIKKKMLTRKNFRRGRRSRNCRHREARWENRKQTVPVLKDSTWCYEKSSSDDMDESKTSNIFNRVSKSNLMDSRYTWERLDKTKSNIKSKTRWKRVRKEHKKRHHNGWVSPSLMTRVFNIQTWVKRLTSICPIDKIAVEHVKFDTQLMQNAEISGVEYQQGELKGYEVKEYLLEKYNRKCFYCDTKNVPLQVEHVIPKAIKVDNRVSNLVISCKQCNLEKGKIHPNQLEGKLGERARKALKNTQTSLADTAHVNSIRWKIVETLRASGLELFCGTGGSTKYNRTKASLPKTHYYDAASVSCIPNDTDIKVLDITAIGYGNRENLGYLFGMKHPGFRKHYNKTVSALMPDGEQRVYKLDHVCVDKPTGKTYGVINCFDATQDGKPQKLRVKHKFDGDHREGGDVSKINKIRCRDGYGYSYV